MDTEFLPSLAEVVIEHASPVQLVAVRSALRPPDVEALRTHMYGSYVMTALESRLAWAQPPVVQHALESVRLAPCLTPPAQ